MKQYLDLLQHTLDHGVDVPNRTGVDTRTVFGATMRFDMNDGFPAITTKKLAFKTMKAELLWLLSGSSDVKDLQKLGCNIWNENAEAPYWKPKARFDGDLGRVYGVQWRHWIGQDGKKIDQIADVIKNIKAVKENPALSERRRLIVTAWNPAELDQMALPPCHAFFQFSCMNGVLSLMLLQRSCDMFLGVPFNIASYSLLLHMVAQVTGLKPGEFVHILGDTHIYHNHFEPVRTQLQREPLPLPKLWLNPDITDIHAFTMDDIRLVGYTSHDAISAPMAV
ncbi:MAG: thymidylate synthase [Parcubacteria group bacterium]|nr:thymidylate synthase [Parcubacteria group bacterium]